MALIKVTDRDGIEHDVEGNTRFTLMENLRDASIELYRLDVNKPDGLMMDSKTGSEWNFQGCAISGKAKGVCLERLPVLKDYWFDWRNYNPKTTIYGKNE